MSKSAQTKIWHPAFDVYHCEFRMLRILLRQENNSLASELLFLLDFYLLYPFLLHRASMPDQTRRAFRDVGVERDTAYFVQVPSAKSLYRDIALFQKTAASGLAAKSIINRDAYLEGTATLHVEFVPQRLRQELSRQNERDSAFMAFLVEKFGAISLGGSRGLRALTGLVRRQ